MKEKKYAAEKIENFQVEVPMEEYVKECVDRLWNTPLRTGDRRYYDNFLYMFAMLALSGNYRIYQK